MTFPDKTVYPFATPNETDFCNLMDVYLNAVFCPLAMVDSAVFEQEGWHRNIVRIIRDPAHDVPMLMRVKIAQRQRLELFKSILSNPLHRFPAQYACKIRNRPLGDGAKPV